MSQAPLPKKRKKVDKFAQAWSAWHKRARAFLGFRETRTSPAEWSEDQEDKREEAGMTTGSDEQRQSRLRRVFGG